MEAVRALEAAGNIAQFVSHDFNVLIIAELRQRLQGDSLGDVQGENGSTFNEL